MSEIASESPPAGAGRAWITLLVLVSLYLLALARSAPPPVLPASAPSTEFSGERALAHLARIEGDGEPHPIGSSANARVRAEVVAAFATLGIRAEVDEHISIGGNGVVAITRNLVARLPGTASTKSVLVVAHHDSVSAGPGTSDDGAGVAAVLEIARALQHERERTNDVVFLIDDGEEAGLIGARAFLAHHPLAKDVGVVVNLEARGTCGRAQMFETSADNRALVAVLSDGVPRPSATSVAYELYRLMPNDTDLSVFKAAGLQGLNFAYIGGLARYHTPRDDLRHLDPRSLQHLGESALGVVRGFARRDLARLEAGSSVYADVLGFTLFHFPLEWTWPLALAALLGSVWFARREDARLLLRACAVLCAGFLASLLGALVLSWTIQRWHGALFPWSAQPLWTRIAVLLGAFTTGTCALQLLARRAVPGSSMRHAVRLLFALGGVSACAFVPSASYLLVFPVLAGLASRAIASRTESAQHFVPLCVLAALLLPILLGVEDAFGYGALQGTVLVPVAAILALLVLAASPAFVRTSPRMLIPPGALAAIALVGALCARPFDGAAPAWLNLVHEHDARAGLARWIAAPIGAPMPVPLRHAAAFEEREDAFEGRIYARPRAGFVAPAQPSTQAPPRLDVLGESRDASRRTVRARLWSPRGALRLALGTSAGTRLRAISRARSSEAGTFVADPHERITEGFASTGIVRFSGLDAPGLVLEFEIEGAAAADVEVVDASAGMPPEFEALSRARPDHYVPRGEGDVSVILERVRL